MNAHLTGWLMITAGSALGLGAIALAVSLRWRRMRQDREWLARAAEKDRDAEYLWWLEGEFIAMDAGELP